MAPLLSVLGPISKPPTVFPFVGVSAHFPLKLLACQLSLTAEVIFPHVHRGRHPHQSSHGAVWLLVVDSGLNMQVSNAMPD